MESVADKGIVYEFGHFVLDPEGKTLYADGQALHLPAKEFETLLLLIRNNGRALSKEEMMAAVWHDSFVEESNLAKQISKLRKVLNTNGVQFIETLPKHGYRFSADLKKVVKTIDEPVILERQTIKRLTVSVDEAIEPDRPTLPAAKRERSRWPAIVLPIVVVIGLGCLLWYLGRGQIEEVDPYQPVRLTDSPFDDTGPNWTRDGRIRFHRLYSKDRHVTLIMNADGSGQTELLHADGRRIFNWSPDEQRILFQKQGDSTKTYLANADGSGEILLPFRAGNWSADSRMLTYRAQVAERVYDVFVYFLESGEIRNLTNSESFNADPSFSPDGRQVVFVSGRDGNAEIYSIGVDGSDLRRLTFDPSIDSHPAYSPDGTAILFTSDRENENADVYLMRADGTGTPFKITNWDKSNETAGPGSWSPDGSRIAFFSDRGGNDDIYVVSAETVRPKPVLSDPERDLHEPSFSPDGKKLVYSLETQNKAGELRVLDIETGRTRLVRRTELPMTAPVWSPDGKRIAFVDRIDGNSEVCAIDPDGSEFVNLTNDRSLDISPSWSPDGTRLAFISHRGEPRGSRLYTMNADGSDPAPVTPRSGWEGDPTWSPDGSTFVFVCDRADSPGNLLDICRINSDGTGEKRVVTNRDHDTQPAISPDGKRIAFVAVSDGNPEIYVVNSDGSGLLRLTRDPADDLSPNWSPDGRRLIFTSNRSGRSAIYEIEVPPQAS